MRRLLFRRSFQTVSCRVAIGLACCCGIGDATSGEIFRCVGSGGSLVFQDAPCGTRGPGLRPRAGAATGFTRPRRSHDDECQLRTAVIPVFTQFDGEETLLDGGAALKFRGSASGFGLSMLVDVRQAPAAHKNPLSSSDCPAWPPRRMGPPPPPPAHCLPPAPLTVSSIVTGQLLMTESGNFEPDAYKSSHELAFGYRRSNAILRSLSAGHSIRLRFRINGLGWVESKPFPLTGLDLALKQLMACAQNLDFS